ATDALGSVGRGRAAEALFPRHDAGIVDRDVGRPVEAPRRIEDTPPADHQGMVDRALRPPRNGPAPLTPRPPRITRACSPAFSAPGERPWATEHADSRAATPPRSRARRLRSTMV